MRLRLGQGQVDLDRRRAGERLCSPFSGHRVSKPVCLDDAHGAHMKSLRAQSFSVSGEWPSLNVLLYGHVRTKMKIKCEWQTAVGWAIRAAKVLPMGRVFISYEHHRKDWRVDLDNAAGFASKIVQGALVECGSLGGDTFE